MRFAPKILALALAGILLGAVRPRAQEQTAAPSPQDEQKSDQQKKEKEKKKKGGGFFGGLKAVSGSSSEQQEATRTAGSKTVGEGAQIGDAQPTADDRATVSAMEGYTLPPAEVKKFQEDGKLKASQ
jgi:hypothetical protein